MQLARLKARLLPVFFALAFVLSASACEGQVDIVHGLNELEANEILVVLEGQGIPARKQKEEGRIVTWAVLVPQSQSMDALRILVANRLPKPRSQGLAEVYPAGSSGLIPTKSEEKAKFLLAMQGEIENMLKSLPGIQDARVTVVIPEKDVVRDLETPPPPATASVAIVYNPEEGGKKPVSEEKVKELVSAAVEDLQPKNVQVIMKENRPPVVISPDGRETGAAPIAGDNVLGIRVVDKKAGIRAKVILGLFVALAIFGLILGIAGIARSISLKARLAKTEAELTSLRKRREMG